MRKTRRTHQRTGRYFLIPFLIVGMTVFYIWEQIIVNQLVRDIYDLKLKRAELKDRNRQLRIEIAKLMSIDRIERIARDSLHMTVLPQEPMILYYEVQNEEQ